MNIPFAGIKQGLAEYLAVFRVLKSEWHAPGKECLAFEEEFGEFIGSKYVLTTNSGSSGNLLALKALDLPAGSKVITSGCGFPATLNPILHLGLTPVLVDYSLPSHNIDLDQLEKVAEGAKAMIIAHTMANPIDMVRVMKIAKKHNLKVIEDCCEALGSTLNGKHVGTFGDLATFSFYPSHQMNGIGMGGAVVTNNRDYAITMRSMRQWGKLIREPRFTGDHVTEYTNEIDGIKYDDQYTYQTIGFNMQMPDIIAAYLRVQLKRLPGFVAKRKATWISYWMSLKPLNKFITMSLVRGAHPSYFGFTLTLKEEGIRDDFASYLEGKGIRTRPFFAGNITRHEPYKHLYQEFPVADYLMRNSLFIGVWPGITRKQSEYVVNAIKEYFE